MNSEVTNFITALQHPLKNEINLLRNLVLSSEPKLQENIKWNGPNFHVAGEDRITMKIHPPTQIQLIFHTGAQKKIAPEQQIITNAPQWFHWRGNDRAVVAFKNKIEIENRVEELQKLVKNWIHLTI